jgi:transposase
MLDNTVVGFGMHHLIVVADKGMMSGMNIAKIRIEHNGYVMSYSVRNANKTFKNYVLEKAGYTEIRDGKGNLVSKHKSRYAPREIWVTDSNAKRKKIIINELQIIIYSEKYTKRALKERQKAIAKAQKQVWSLSKNAKASNYGSAKYIKKVPFDKATGEYDMKSNYIVFLDEERIDENQRLDVYYVICTNVAGLAEGEKPFNRRCRYRTDEFF